MDESRTQPLRPVGPGGPDRPPGPSREAGAERSPSRSADPLLGQRLGPYRLRARLGAGGMAAVYRARDEALDRDVAVKILPEGLCADERSVERFLREARAVARVSHPNLVHIYAVGEEAGRYYYAMELFEGETLAERIARLGRRPADEIVRVAAEVAAALERVHALGIVHRDVKSANIMFAADGRAVLMDFGLAKAADLSAVTLEGTVLGTPAFMSPEQAEGREVDPRSDLYSLGVVLYHMAAGELPFRGTSTLSILRRQIEEAPRPMAEVRPDLPAPLAAAIARAMEKDPRSRFQSLGELAGALLAVSEAPALREILAHERAAASAAAGTLVGAAPAARTAGAALPEGARTARTILLDRARKGLLPIAAAVALLLTALAMGLLARKIDRGRSVPARLRLAGEAEPVRARLLDLRRRPDGLWVLRYEVPGKRFRPAQIVTKTGPDPAKLLREAEFPEANPRATKAAPPASP